MHQERQKPELVGVTGDQFVGESRTVLDLRHRFACVRLPAFEFGRDDKFEVRCRPKDDAITELAPHAMVGLVLATAYAAYVTVRAWQH